MNVIKVEAKGGEDLSFNSCLICLQKLSGINEEEFNSLKLFFKYLNISEIKGAKICDKCGEKLGQFIKLSKFLEKVSMEMDYLLDFVRNEINSKKENVPERISSIRKYIRKKCKEEISNPMPKIILERVKPLTKMDLQSPSSDCSPDYSPNWNDDEHNDSSSSDSVHLNERSSTPEEGRNLENATATTKKQPHRNCRVKCTKCSKTFSNKYILKRHNEAVHLRLKPLKCSKCPKSFYKTSTLRRHINSVHLRLKSFKCSFCSEAFIHQYTWRKHEYFHLHPKPPQKCFKCHESFPDVDSLRSHQETSHKLTNHENPAQLPPPSTPSARLSCNICAKKFTVIYSLKRHIANVHEKKRYFCQAPNCTKSFAFQHHLPNHYKLAHPDFTVPPRKDYSDKFAVVIENGKRLYECRLCEGSRFKSLGRATGHFRLVHGPKNFFCEECGFTTSIKDNLKRHVETKHGKGNIPCEFCGKLFSCINSVKIHIKMIHGPKKFKCQECTYETNFKYDFNKHVKYCLKRKHKKMLNESEKS